jgi:uncharacterized phage protein (TIGR02220 family)
MEITVENIKDLKLSPSLICFLKAINDKDNLFLTELHNVSDLFIMGKHLEKLNLLKIVGSELSYESFEIRRLGLIDYLNNETNNSSNKKEIDEVIEYLNNKTGKEFKKKTSSHRKFISGRLNEGYSIDDLKYVIDIMCEEWKDTNMDMYLRPETLFNPTKFQTYINKKTLKKQLTGVSKNKLI